MSAALSTRHAADGALSASSRCVRFFAAGMPSTKGSARAFVVGKRAIITNDAGAKAKAWAAIVSHEAMNAIMGAHGIGAVPFDEPVSIHVVFYLPRPKSHSTKRGLRPDAPTYHASKPDGDKLIRCAVDALIGVVVSDDSRIARWFFEKRYADGTVGAEFTVEPIGGE